MRSLSNRIDFQTMLYVYFSYFQPHILYGITIFWANSSDAITAFRKQKKIIRLITKSSFGHPCRQHFRRLKMFLFHLCNFLCTPLFRLFLKTRPTTLMNSLLTLLKPYTCNFSWTTGFTASRSTSSLDRFGSGLSRMLVKWLKVFYIGKYSFTMNVCSQNLF